MNITVTSISLSEKKLGFPFPTFCSTNSLRSKALHRSKFKKKPCQLPKSNREANYKRCKISNTNIYFKTHRFESILAFIEFREYLRNNILITFDNILTLLTQLLLSIAASWNA